MTWDERPAKSRRTARQLPATIDVATVIMAAATILALLAMGPQ